MITVSYIWDALKGTFKFIYWLFSGMIFLTLKAVVILTVTVWAVIIFTIGWIVKEIINYILKKAGIDTSKWKSPVTWDSVESGLDRWNRKLDYRLHRMRNPQRRRSSADITIDEMILYDIIDDD